MQKAEQTPEVQLKLLQQEFSEFQQSSKEYEDELEQEILQKEESIQYMEQQIEELKVKVDKYKQLYLEQCKEVGKLQDKCEGLQSNITHSRRQTIELEQVNDFWENSARILEYTKQELEERLILTEENASFYQEELDKIQQTHQIEIQRMKEEYDELLQELIALKNKEQKNKDQNSILSVSVIKSTPRTTDLRVQVQGVLRNVDESSYQVYENSLMPLPDDDQIGIMPKSYHFDKIYCNPNGLMAQDLYKILSNNYSDQKLCFISYGATGTGKTSLIAQVITDTVAYMSKARLRQQCKFCAIEVFENKIRDLFKDDRPSTNLQNVIKSGTLYSSCINDIQQQIQDCIQNRVNSSHAKTHAIFTLTYKDLQMQFVDLTGSESVPNLKGKENVKINGIIKSQLQANKSLFALQEVILALISGQSYIPYRNSLLTQLLKPSMSRKNCDILLNINLASTLNSDNLQSLGLADKIFRAKQCSNPQQAKAPNMFQIGRTSKLLQKQKSTNQALILKVEKLEKDASAYKQAIVTKNQQIKRLKHIIRQDILKGSQNSTRGCSSPVSSNTKHNVNSTQHIKY